MITLCGENGCITLFDVVDKNKDNEVKTQLKSPMGWKMFAISNNFKPNDIIRFNFPLINPVHKCQVYNVYSSWSICIAGLYLCISWTIILVHIILCYFFLFNLKLHTMQFYTTSTQSIMTFYYTNVTFPSLNRLLFFS
jgi:hypothetical protein